MAVAADAGGGHLFHTVRLPQAHTAGDVNPLAKIIAQRIGLIGADYCGGVHSPRTETRRMILPEPRHYEPQRTTETGEPEESMNGKPNFRERRPTLLQLAWILGAVIAGVSSTSSLSAEQPIPLADPTAPLQETWTFQRFTGETDYRRTKLDGVPTIRAVGRMSASGLYRDVDYRLANHPWLEWTWRVDKLQRTADIRVKDREDFAAAIFLIFGHPSMLNPDVPTLAYVWTSDLLPEGSVVGSPHHPDSVRDIVVRSGTSRLGQWVNERRNAAEDFRRAFGREPPDTVGVLALFTDNDQTGEPVEAYYGAIWARSE